MLDKDTTDDDVSESEVEAEMMDETPPMSPIELKPELPPYFPALQGCRNVEEFHCLNRIEEGTYGVVYRARDMKTGTPQFYIFILLLIASFDMVINFRDCVIALHLKCQDGCIKIKTNGDDADCSVKTKLSYFK